jgi:glyoxylase-like metal-dependent hydrolase (beta-lactamase superfamily II)
LTRGIQLLDFVQLLSNDFNNIFFVRGERNGNYPYSHSLLVGDYLIDTGISSGYIKKLKKQYPINHVLLSHWHEDHISGNHLLTNANFLCHEKDKLPIEDIEKMLLYYNVENTVAGKEFSTIFGLYGMRNTQISKYFKDNEIMSIGDNLKLKVILIPGHTAGHCGFYEINSKIAFLGDMDLTRFPYYATIDSNLIDFENSIERLKTYDIEIAVVGHRDPVVGSTNIKVELDNFKSVIQKRDERILSNLHERKPIHPTDLKSKNLIYRRYTYENFEIISEIMMIEKHFEKFLKENLISIKGDGYILT